MDKEVKPIVKKIFDMMIEDEKKNIELMRGLDPDLSEFQYYQKLGNDLGESLSDEISKKVDISQLNESDLFDLVHLWLDHLNRMLNKS